ncbi:hypothetical protein, partial [Novipirellula herctigrandis]|uniref:hypothetical protein n=1 Tax=Novipirellula herctigrandis TaxID=2527986 RepID=UPI003AF3C13C
MNPEVDHLARFVVVGTLPFASFGVAYGLLFTIESQTLSGCISSGNGTDQRGPGIDYPFVKTNHRSSVASDG